MLVQTYGMSASLRDLSAMNGAQFAEDLRRRIQQDRKQNEDHWTGLKEADIQRSINRFASNVSHRSIQRHLTLETWMRNMVDWQARKVQGESEGRDESSSEQGKEDDEFKDISALTRPLALTFGGSTRYEFSARGSWYPSDSPSDSNQRVDDILIVVEFCAQSSTVARSLIKDQAVHYLSKIAGEEAVMVQEIPTHAHIWSPS
jgi:hypothetical protein